VKVTRKNLSLVNEHITTASQPRKEALSATHSRESRVHPVSARARRAARVRVNQTCASVTELLVSGAPRELGSIPGAYQQIWNVWLHRYV